MCIRYVVRNISICYRGISVRVLSRGDSRAMAWAQLEPLTRLAALLTCTLTLTTTLFGGTRKPSAVGFHPLRWNDVG